MRNCRIVLLAAVLVTLGAALIGLALRPSGGYENVYRGRTSDEWARVLSRWDICLEGSGSKSGRFAFWYQRQSSLENWLEKIGLSFAKTPTSLPLLEGDVEAVPVLTELLQHSEEKVRRVAAQGLEKVGKQAKPAVPALLEALDDPDEQVRGDVEQALFRIDPEAAERVGCKLPGR